MSRGFVKEYEDQWLHDIHPTMTALVRFLTIENNGIRVYEKRSYTADSGKEIHEMSNGISYSVTDQGRWVALDE